MNPMKAVGDEIRSSLKAATKSPSPEVAKPDAAARPMAEPVAAPAAVATGEEPKRSAGEAA